MALKQPQNRETKPIISALPMWQPSRIQRAGVSTDLFCEEEEEDAGKQKMMNTFLKMSRNSSLDLLMACSSGVERGKDFLC